jgi:4-hydroxybenzoate polyprenyltransferase
MTAETAPRPTATQWLAGARPRTLPAACSPVIAGTGLAVFEQGASWVAAVLALVVSLALQVGVNYANDYSDGIRGTDNARVGPQRLVGSGLASPPLVKRAAFISFGIACLAGLGLVIMTQHWWLLAVGVACVLAAWYYTGGRHPYGYVGLGEVFVFVFFGLVAVCGTAYVQVGRVSLATLLTGVWVGALACGILVANNLRDIPAGGPQDPRSVRDLASSERSIDHHRGPGHHLVGAARAGWPDLAHSRDPGGDVRSRRAGADRRTQSHRAGGAGDCHRIRDRPHPQHPLVTRLSETHVHVRSSRSTSVATCVTRRQRTCT